VHLVHAQIRDHEVRAEAARGGQCLRGTLHRLHVVALRAQPYGEQPQQPRIVIDHQYSRFAFAGLIQDRFLVHHGHRPELPCFRSFSERSMLAMASSFARASSSSLRRRAFSSNSVCSRWLALATCSRSARTASACSLKFSASSVKWSSICESVRKASARSPGRSISGLAMSSRSSPCARVRLVAGWPGVPRTRASFRVWLGVGAVSYSRWALATISACSEGWPCTSFCSSSRSSFSTVEEVALGFTMGGGAGGRCPEVKEVQA